MIVGLGIDICEQARIRDSLTKLSTTFTQRIFTAPEIAYCERYRDPTEHYAARFAAKEAFMKAIGTGMQQGVTFKDIEVINHASGAPFLNLYGQAHQIAENLNVKHIHLSISHSAGIAVAVVILETIP
jgi:holo-[acyl-carrier protein] synthase